MQRYVWLTAVFAALFVGVVLGQSGIPKLEQRVTDFTNTLSYVEWNLLEKKLKSFEDTTSTQIAVLIVSNMGGVPAEEYANKVFEQNKIGQKGKNNGALMLVAKDEKTVRIEVGYGLEGSLTDAACSQIIERQIKPRFSEGNFFAGISDGISSMIAATAGEYKVESAGKQAPLIALILVIAFVVFFFFVFLPFAVARRKYVIGKSGWRYYPGWGYSSGSSFGGSVSDSGGLGGWSGGGGLSGGGGATGKW